MSATTAWDLIGFPRDADECNQMVRVVGGRAKYEAVTFTDGGRQQQVKLSRLDVTGAGLHQVDRYVDPDTELEVVADA